MRLFVFFLSLVVSEGVVSAQAEPFALGVSRSTISVPVPVLDPAQDLGPEADLPSLNDLDTLPEAPEEAQEGAEVVPQEGEQTPMDRLFDDLASADGDAQAKMRAYRIQIQWLKSGSDTVDLLMQRAGAALQQEDLNLAQDLLDVVVTLAPDYAEGWNRRATVFYMKSDLAKSLADIERTLSLEPRHWGALSGLAIIQRRMGQESRSLETFRRALAINPGLKSARDAIDSLEDDLSGEDI